MKIDVNSSVLSGLTVESGAKQVSNGSPIAVRSTPEDRTTLRSDSSSVQALTNQAMQTPQVRQAKVDSLAQSVNSGHYRSDASETATGILENESLSPS